MSSKTTITNRPSHRLFAVTKAEGQDKASWLEIGAAWPNKDGKGFSLKLKAMPMPGSEIVLRINEPSEAKASPDWRSLRRSPALQRIHEAAECRNRIRHPVTFEHGEVFVRQLRRVDECGAMLSDGGDHCVGVILDQ